MSTWERVPFYVGCSYLSDKATVTGFYSPKDPLEFESDCRSWTASNAEGSFPSAEEAMRAAEKAA